MVRKGPGTARQSKAKSTVASHVKRQECGSARSAGVPVSNRGTAAACHRRNGWDWRNKSQNYDESARSEAERVQSLQASRVGCGDANLPGFGSFSHAACSLPLSLSLSLVVLSSRSLQTPKSRVLSGRSSALGRDLGSFHPDAFCQSGRSVMVEVPKLEPPPG